MNIHQEFKDDPLRRYLRSEITEVAPAGFTEKIMTRVSLEARPVRSAENVWKINSVPVISVAVILVLLTAALLLPSSGYDLSSLPLLKMVQSISLQSFKAELDSLLKIRLPVYIPYLFLCLFLLTVFDRALNVLFHREK